MNTSNQTTVVPPIQDSIPIGSLFLLALAGFVTLMTEVMPAGLLPLISSDLKITESLSGQLVTAYAVGSFVTALPLMLFTQTMSRRRLLLAALVGFVVVNLATAISNFYWLTIIARFLAGMCGGLVWALLVGYATRLVPPHLVGRAIAITGIGAPLAFSLGVPAGTLLGGLFGWRLSFGAMSALALALTVWVVTTLPDFSGQSRCKRLSVSHVAMLPGLRTILFTMFVFVVAHNILYTYIVPFLALSDLASRVDLILLIFGLAGIAGLWIAGILIDNHLRKMVLGSLLVFAGVSAALGFGEAMPAIILVSVVPWGIVVGGAPALFQTAEAKVAGKATDVAQAMFVTVWNTGVAGGGVIGGILLDGPGASAFPWAILILMILTLSIFWKSKCEAFADAKT